MSTTQWDGQLTVPVSEERDHIQGPADAAVTLVEYGDYECPVLRRRVSDRQGGAGPAGRRGSASCFATSRSRPRTRTPSTPRRPPRPRRPRASSGRCTTCSTRTSSASSDQDLLAYAEKLGLDVDRFDRELAEHVHAARVREDFMSGVRSGVNGTPTFYINGARHDDSYDLETLTAALQAAAH